MLKSSFELCLLKLGKQMKELGYFWSPSETRANFLYQGDIFELDSVQYIFDQNTKLNMSTKFNFSNSTTGKIINAGNNIDRQVTWKKD